MIDLMVDFLFPKRCYGCGRYESDLCNDCSLSFSFADQLCPECGEESPMGWVHSRCKSKNGMDGLIVVFDYQDKKVRGAIDGVKFDFNREIVKKMLKGFYFETGESFDFLVPVPLHFYRENWRGYNQATEIAKVVGEKMGIEVFEALRRKRKTKQQSLISDKVAREKNVKDAFEVKDDYKKQIGGKKVLLVDDVFTSGADMRECTKMLKRAGVQKVWGLALAH